MKHFLFSFLCGSFVTVGSFAQDADFHQPWAQLLQRHVDGSGKVSYKGFVKDSTALNQYLKLLSNNRPGPKSSREQRLAYWINAYNAFTIKLIVDHYPVAGIKEIKRGVPFLNSVWDLEFFEIGGQKIDLNHIEHAILRKEFDEPRIHFAIVCASLSCPKLLNEAYTAEKLEQQLHEQAMDFINDPERNVIGKDQLRLSSIFNWFEKDFTRNGTLKQYIAKYAETKFDANAKVTFLDYDWTLNGE